MTPPAPAPTEPPVRRSRPPRLYVLVLAGMAAGALTGWAAPDVGAQLKPLSDLFVRLLKMLVGPIVFVTIVLGIAGLRDIGRVGRIGGKALAYFLVLTSAALVIGLVVVNLLRPGDGLHADPRDFDAGSVATVVDKAHHLTPTEFLTGVVPDTFVSAFTSGDLLQVLLVAVLFGLAATSLDAQLDGLLRILELVSRILLRILSWVMYLAPVAVFGAIAFTVSRIGPAALGSLAYLMLCFYLTCLLFIVVVLGGVAALAGVNLFRLIGFIKVELLTAFGTASSESVLAPLMAKLERLGAAKEVVGLVVPSGYSFNMDGNSIYLTMAALFLAQALDIPLSLGEQLGLLGVAIVTSKGSSGVAGSGFVVLAATLAATPTIPVAAVALILGIDRFMSEARVITNIIGNCVATLVIARWEGELDVARMQRELG